MVKRFFRYVAYLSFMVCIAVSCKPLPNVQGKGQLFMQGIWNEDSVANSVQLLNYTQHKFKFTCDSFYVELVTHSKVNYYADSCFNKGIWKEYAKGVYDVRNDSLFLEGTYTKSNYKQKVTGCYQIGRYLKTFYIRSKGAENLLMESTNDQRECALILKEKIICTPKSL